MCQMMGHMLQEQVQEEMAGMFGDIDAEAVQDSLHGTNIVISGGCSLSVHLPTQTHQRSAS